MDIESTLMAMCKEDVEAKAVPKLVPEHIDRDPVLVLHTA